MKKFIFVAFLATFILSGCGAFILFGAGTAAGVGGYKYYQGALTVTYDAPFEETWDAGLKAAKQLEFTLGTSEHDLTTGQISCKRSDGTPVTIKMKYVSTHQTEVEIRVGLLGEEQGSVAVKNKIAEVLAAA